MQAEFEDRSALGGTDQSMARLISAPPAVMAEGLEDDHSLPVMQFSSLTTALLGADHSDRIGISTVSDRGPCDPLMAIDRVSGCRPRRTYEQRGQSGSLALEISRHESPDEPAVQHSCLPPVLREGKGSSIIQEKACAKELVECEECAQPLEESSDGSVAYRTACRSMLPTCGDGSQAQSVPKLHIVTDRGPLADSTCVREQQPLMIQQLIIRFFLIGSRLLLCLSNGLVELH